MEAHPTDASAVGSDDGSVSVSKDGLRIRFKLPKNNEPSDEVAHDLVSSERSSGRSSDGDPEGHKAPTSPLEIERDVVMEDSGSSRAQKIPTCSECSKTFWSDKALYGHLRCHPHRDHGGANPPPLEAQMKRLPLGWSVTAKRGRRQSSNDLDCTTAATILFLMSRGIHADPSQERKWKSRSNVSTEGDEGNADPSQYREWKSSSNVSTDDGEGNAEDGQLSTVKCLGHANALGDWNQHTDGKEGNDDEYVETPSSCLSVVDKKIKKKRSVHASIAPPRGRRHDRRYKCRTCHKFFPTHQALGGHKASHNRSQNNPAEVEQLVAVEVGGIDQDAGLNNPVGVGLVAVDVEGIDQDAGLTHAEELVDANDVVTMTTAKEYRCQICNRTFRNGQALGGHKHVHSASLRNRAKKLFDPNEPKKLEEE